MIAICVLMVLILNIFFSTQHTQNLKIESSKIEQESARTEERL